MLSLSMLALRTQPSVHALTRAFAATSLRPAATPKSPKTETKTAEKTKSKPTPTLKPKPKPEHRVRSKDIPRNGPGAFVHYMNTCYNIGLPTVDASNFKERTIEAAQAWRNLPQEEQQVCPPSALALLAFAARFCDEARALRDAARIKRREYLTALDPAVLREYNARRTARGKGRVIAHGAKRESRPANAYILFLMHYREQHATTLEGQSFTEVGRAVAEVWRGMSDIEKEPWVRRYQEARAKWYEAHPKPDSTADASA
ncbi:hypothetical protein H0H81_005043 [Sphagnurus paluster]|uniref:HMG box domain-containing protein n=1 Tax=Sphagnurus paluster TaxID=117069 RepID=A0A9P7FXZ5_9AGAR|nr:hypothetical protein H0H81_005043 [Sphagnurus paluster]